jgi:hypothetical protein
MIAPELNEFIKDEETAIHVIANMPRRLTVLPLGHTGPQFAVVQAPIHSSRQCKRPGIDFKIQINGVSSQSSFGSPTGALVPWP